MADHSSIARESLSSTTFIKDSTGNILRDEKEILLRWSEYFEDLLKPVRATPTDTCDTIDFGKEEVFTLTEVAATIKGLKSLKAAGEDEIQLKMLKALNGEGVRLLTSGVEIWKNTKTLADRFDHSCMQEKQSKRVYNLLRNNTF